MFAKLWKAKIKANLVSRDEFEDGIKPEWSRRGEAKVADQKLEEDYPAERQEPAETRPHVMVYVIKADPDGIAKDMKILSELTSFLNEHPQPRLKIVVALTQLDVKDKILVEHPERLLEGRQDSKKLKEMLNTLRRTVQPANIFPIINGNQMPENYNPWHPTYVYKRPDPRLLFVHTIALRMVDRVVEMGKDHRDDLEWQHLEKQRSRITRNN